MSDWVHLNPSADEDALSGRPEVVGCGRSVGGVVNACVATHVTPVNPARASGAQQTSPSTAFFDANPSMSRGHSGLLMSPKPIQLQRMISRCSCQVFYVHYKPADPAKLPPQHLIPPLVSAYAGMYHFIHGFIGSLMQVLHRINIVPRFST